MTATRPIHTVACAAFSVSLLVLAACSDGDDGSSSAGEPTTTDTSLTANPTTSSPEVVAATDGPATTATPDEAGSTTVSAVETTTSAPVIATVPEADSVLAIINERDDLTVFARLAETIGSPTVFQQERGVTILAPTDAAWSALFVDDQIEAIMADRDAAALWLSEHLAIGGRTVADLQAEGAFRNAMTRSWTIEERQDGTYVGGARFVTPDLEADNGFVHVIDSVLIPPTP